jgi:hypothetical protein
VSRNVVDAIEDLNRVCVLYEILNTTGNTTLYNRRPAYNWLTNEQVRKSMQRFDYVFRGCQSFDCEHSIEIEWKERAAHYNVKGRVDIITDADHKVNAAAAGMPNNPLIWEIKTKNQIDRKDFLQLLIYMYLYYKKTGRYLPGRLYNVNRNELYEIDIVDDAAAGAMANTVVDATATANAKPIAGYDQGYLIGMISHFITALSGIVHTADASNAVNTTNKLKGAVLEKIFRTVMSDYAKIGNYEEGIGEDEFINNSISVSQELIDKYVSDMNRGDDETSNSDEDSGENGEDQEEYDDASHLIASDSD